MNKLLGHLVFLEIFNQFSTLKNYFENQNFEMLEEVVHNFGKYEDDIISWKNAYFHYMHTWFHVQLDQIILKGL